MKLLKMSEPGFVLQSEHPSVIRQVLELYICPECYEESIDGDPPLKEYYHDLPSTEQVQELLRTQCGAEFMVEGLSFVGFLKQMRAYDAYMANSEGKDFEAFLRDYSQSEYVTSAFLWHHTPEGTEYWLEIHELWLEECCA